MTQLPIPQKRLTIIKNQFINEFGTSKLADLGVFKGLILALSDNDAQWIRENDIFFNPIWSPASISDLIKPVPVPAKIITIDINSMTQFSVDEAVAIILHEIGHAANPKVKGIEGEFAADDYAVKRHYGLYIISSLNKMKNKFPEQYENSSTHKRITRISDLLQQNSSQFSAI